MLKKPDTVSLFLILFNALHLVPLLDKQNLTFVLL